MMEKAAALDADEVFFDLEDACAPREKESARSLAVEALRTLDFGASARAFRMNDLTTAWAERDVLDVVGGVPDQIDALIVPKVEDAGQIARLEALLARIEAGLGSALRLRLELQIESPRGVVNLAQITTASPRTSAIVFGPGDYAASMGIHRLELGSSDDRYPGHQWHWVMCEIAVHARAAGLRAIDGPVADVADESSFRVNALTAQALGFEGKWCIHPTQVPWANDVFSPSSEEIEAAAALIEAYDSARDQGVGAIAVGGKLVDEASRKIAEATLARARAAGLY
jgi:citrate lyase beta subunit